jgi:dGTPase
MPPVVGTEEHRERTEEIERASLSTWAALASGTKGRDRYEPDDPIRTVFQVDRERVVACAGWRALAGRSGALPARTGRSRLDETVEGVQIARAIGRALRLNEDLVEAIAAGQLLGSTPFAAAGEEALALATGVDYRPEEQALRIVERVAAAGAGLNLTWEARDGILHQRWDGPAPSTLEGQVARVARRIVAVSAALDDAAVAGHASHGPLADSHAARVEQLVGAAIRTSVDRTEVGLGELAGPVDDAAAAAAAVLDRAPAVLDARTRAVHCIASVVVHALEAGLPEGDGPADLRRVVDVVAGETDGGVIARYRGAFEPPSRPALQERPAG